MTRAGEVEGNSKQKEQYVQRHRGRRVLLNGWLECGGAWERVVDVRLGSVQ